MIRSWGIVTLTGAAQPIVGDKITAAFVVPAAGQLAKVINKVEHPSTAFIDKLNILLLLLS